MKSSEVLYIDYNATTPVDPLVVEAMFPYFTEHFGNPSSSSHWYGWRASTAVDVSRQSIASEIGATEELEIIFTSGATESISLALRGLAESSHQRHFITIATEHKAVLDTVISLQKYGHEYTIIDTDANGIVSLESIQAALKPNTICVSVMLANNETGVVQDIAPIGLMCRNHGVYFHSDITQAVGKIPVDVTALNVDLASFSSHKFYGPKGIGCLYRRKIFPKIPLHPQVIGGGQEFNLRSGTVNVPAIIGMAKAMQLTRVSMESQANRLVSLRNSLWTGLESSCNTVLINGFNPIDNSDRVLPNTLNCSFLGVPSSTLITAIKDIAVSTSSACNSELFSQSHVLQAMKYSSERIDSAIRFSLGRYTTQEEIDYTIETFSTHYNRIYDLLHLPTDV